MGNEVQRSQSIILLYNKASRKPKSSRIGLDLDDTAGAIGHAVIISPDRHEAIKAHAPFELQYSIEAVLRQTLQFGLLVRKGLGDNALGGAVNTHIGNGIEPSDKLGIQILEIA